MNQTLEAPPTTGQWQTLAPFPEPTWEMEGIESAGQIYLIGGITNAYGARSGWIPNRLTYAYDPAADRWTRKAPIPVGMHHMALAECGGMVYGFGGFKTPEQGPDGWEPVNRAWRYDPRADAWSEIAPLPIKLGAASASTLNGKIYIAGGTYACKRPGQAAADPTAPHMSTGQLAVYDPVADRYEQAAPLLTARNHHVLEAVGGKLYAIGGRVGASNIWFANKIDLVEEYDPAHDAWYPRARMLAVHSAMAAGVHDGAVYVAGGEGVPMVEKFEPALDRWSVVAQMPRPRLGGSGAIADGRFHIIAGHVRTSTGSEAVGDNVALELN